MTETTYSVTQLAKAIGKTPQTVRNWSDRYAPYMSEHASTDTDQERRFNEQDIEILYTITQLVEKGQRHTEIAKLIQAGERVPMPQTTQAPQPGPAATPNEPTTALVPQSNPNPTTHLEHFVIRYEQQIDDLQRQLKESESKRVFAEIMNAKLATQLEATRYRQYPWQFWRPIKPTGDNNR